MPKTKNKAKREKTMTLFLAFLASSPDEASCHAVNCLMERSHSQKQPGECVSWLRAHQLPHMEEWKFIRFPHMMFFHVNLNV